MWLMIRNRYLSSCFRGTYRRCAIASLKDHGRSWHLSFVSPSFECLKAAAAEGMGIAVLARALVSPPLRIVRQGRRLPQLPAVELAYSYGRRSNSRVVGELANHLADSLAAEGHKVRRWLHFDEEAYAELWGTDDCSEFSFSLAQPRQFQNRNLSPGRRRGCSDRPEGFGDGMNGSSVPGARPCRCTNHSGSLYESQVAPFSSCQTKALSGRSFPMVWTDCINGVPKATTRRQRAA